MHNRNVHPLSFMKVVTGASFSALLLNNAINWVIVFLEKRDLDIIEAQSFGFLCIPNVCYRDLMSLELIVIELQVVQMSTFHVEFLTVSIYRKVVSFSSYPNSQFHVMCRISTQRNYSILSKIMKWSYPCP